MTMLHDPTLLDAAWSAASGPHHPPGSTGASGHRRSTARRRLVGGIAAAVVAAAVVAAVVAGGSPGGATAPATGTTVDTGGWSRVEVTIPLADGSPAVCYGDRTGALTCARATDEGSTPTGLAALDVVCGEVPGAPPCAIGPEPQG